VEAAVAAYKFRLKQGMRPDYNPCGWRDWLNNTTITLEMQNVFDEDPPFVNSAIENGYDEPLATIKGRFWYVQLKKRF
jgi:outer membrane receptor protein involved in Fe transport